MAQVDFHTEVADKVDYVARLVRKGSRQGARLVVVCEDPQAVSVALWGGVAVDFVVHATANSDAATLLVSPVVLMTSAVLPGRDFSQDVLVNASEAWPETYAEFSRVIELVGQSPSDVKAGRERWKQYISAGIVPKKLG